MRARFLWRAFKARYRDQVAELTAIRRHVRPGDTVCDVGAHKGSYLYWLSRWVGDRGRVVAFEPQQRLAQYLRQACTAMALANVTVEAKAVCATSGTTTLYLPADQDDSPDASLTRRLAEQTGCREVAVAMAALDDYFAPDQRIAALKIDVEGAEMGVFRGARRILTEQSPLLVFECENRHLAPGSVTDVFGYLAALGYDGRFVCTNTLRPLARFDPAVHQQQLGDRFWDAKGYCNNFVFKKTARAAATG